MYRPAFLPFLANLIEKTMLGSDKKLVYFLKKVSLLLPKTLFASFKNHSWFLNRQFLLTTNTVFTYHACLISFSMKRDFTLHGN